MNMIRLPSLLLAALLSPILSPGICRAVCTMPDDNLYRFEAVVNSVYDGDTVRADLLLLPEGNKKKEVFQVGNGLVMKNMQLRLRGIDAPEMRGVSVPEKMRAKASRAFLSDMVLGRHVIVVTDHGERDKYGRIVADIWVLVDGKWHHVNRLMVFAGHATPAEY